MISCVQKKGQSFEKSQHVTDGEGMEERGKRERETLRETDRQTDRRTDGQTDRQTGRQMDRQTDGRGSESLRTIALETHRNLGQVHPSTIWATGECDIASFRIGAVGTSVGHVHSFVVAPGRDVEPWLQGGTFA